jgi:gliding motility-associated-like protein
MSKGLSRFFALVVLVSLAFTSSTFSQEICDNGIDDDNDGLVDLHDPDCDCEGFTSYVNSIIPNPSFEDKLGCPTGFEQLDSVKNWIQASDGTTDYIHQCGFMADGFIQPPLPFPDSQACVGLATYLSDTEIQEYVGTCLSSPLEKDSSYTLKFYVGFGIEVQNDEWDVYSSSPVKMALYGNTSCNQLPYPRERCPTAFSGSNWEAIDTIEVSGREEWVEAEFEFHPTKMYRAIILGAPCGSKNLDSNQVEYYFLDNLILSKSKNFVVEEPISNGSICDSSLILRSPRIDSSFSYQWYKDSIALQGETFEELNLRGGAIEGNYQVMISKGIDCQISIPINISSNLNNSFEITGPTVLCENSSAILRASKGYVDYVWSTGERADSIEINTGGIYEVSAVDSFGCILNATLNIIGPVSIDLNANITDAQSTNDNGTINLNPSGGSSPYTYNWSNGSPNQNINGLSSGTYAVTVEDDNGCTRIDSFEVDFVPDDLEANIRVNNLECYNDNSGRITLEIRGGMPELSVLWNTGDTSLEIDNLSAGTYSVTITDAVGDRLVLNPTVEQPDPLEVTDAQLRSPSCNGFSNGAIETTISGGTPNYSYGWNGDSSSTEDLTNVPAGRYQLRVTDDHGCTLSKNFELQEPEPLEANWDYEAPSCYGFEDGFIKVNNIRGGTHPYIVQLNNEVISQGGELQLGAGSYQLEIEDNKGCQINETIILDTPPQIEIEAYTDKNEIMKGGQVQLGGDIYPAELTSYKLEWFSNTVGPQIQDKNNLYTTARPERSTTFTLSLDKNGCLYSDEVYVEVIPINFYAPNAFSPNGDGINEVFTFSSNFNEGLIIKELVIHDRWGGLIHNIRNVALSQYEGWDGRLQGQPLKTGVYVYHLTLENGRGEVFRYAGDVFLKR